MHEIQRTAVLCDEHPLWMVGLENLLTTYGIRVAARTGSLEQALELVRADEPDLCFVGDESTADPGPLLAFLRTLGKEFPKTRAIVFSEDANQARVRSVLAAGAAAYVLKHADTEDVALAIRQVYQRSVYLGDGQVKRTAIPSPPAAKSFPLTPRQLEILGMVAEGRPNAELAQILGVSEQTVKFHLTNIFRKLHVSNRTEAVRWGRINGLLVDGPVAALETVSTDLA